MTGFRSVRDFLEWSAPWAMAIFILINIAWLIQVHEDRARALRSEPIHIEIDYKAKSD